jgi:hypothetical protein
VNDDDSKPGMEPSCESRILFMILILQEIGLQVHGFEDNADLYCCMSGKTNSHYKGMYSST